MIRLSQIDGPELLSDEPWVNPSSDEQKHRFCVRWVARRNIRVYGEFCKPFSEYSLLECKIEVLLACLYIRSVNQQNKGL